MNTPSRQKSCSRIVEQVEVVKGIVMKEKLEAVGNLTNIADGYAENAEVTGDITHVSKQAEKDGKYRSIVLKFSF